MIIRLSLILAIIAAVSGGFFYVRHQAYADGAQAERTATLKKSISLVQERDKLDVQVRTATARDICSRLGGHWLQDTDECG